MSEKLDAIDELLSNIDNALRKDALNSGTQPEQLGGAGQSGSIHPTDVVFSGLTDAVRGSYVSGRSEYS